MFLILGLILCLISALIPNDAISAIFGVLACTLFWCIRELKEQEERVKRGWFPENPNRKNYKKELDNNA